jgi:hypothetical protein
MITMKSFIVWFFFLAACSSQAVVRGAGITEEFHQSYKLSSDGKVRLNNVNGGIEINAWDKNEVRVDAVKHADDKGMMEHLQIVVDASSDLVDIDTKYPQDSNTHNDNGPWVEYTITVPRDASLDKVKTINGEIEIDGVEGSVDASTINGNVRVSDAKNDCRLETVNGKIEAVFASLKSGADVTLKSVNGSITVDLPAGSSVKIKAKTVSGRISNDFGLVSSRESDERSFVTVGDSVDGKVGGGVSDFDAETVNGNIKILKSGESK